MYKIVLLMIFMTLASCVYYQGKPKDWVGEVLEIENCNVFNGRYKLVGGGDSVGDNGFNYLNYLADAPVSGRNRVVLPNLKSVTFKVTESLVSINLYSEFELVYQSSFDKKSFECSNDSLAIKFKTQFSGGTGADFYVFSTITIFMASNNELFVKRKESSVGAIFLIPAVTGGNIWFKLKENKNITK